MNWFIYKIGGIRVDRDSYDFSFMSEMEKALEKGQVGLVFPESRIPLEEEREKGELLEFKPSYVYIALESDIPIIPVYTNGIYGKDKRKKKDRTKIVIGEKIYVKELYDNEKSEKENIEYINDYVRNKISELKDYLN